MSDSRRRRPQRQLGHKEEWGGSYFITFTVFTPKRDTIPRLDGSLATIQKSSIDLSPRGEIVEQVWQELPMLFNTVEIGASVIMPDHFHGILDIKPMSRASGSNLKFKPLSQIVGALKSLSTKRMNEQYKQVGASFWQLGFYDRVIRDESIRSRVERYIYNNPIALRRRAAAYDRDNGGGGLQPATTIVPAAGKGE